MTSENSVDFSTARSDANNRGGQLAVIRNIREFLYVCNWLDKVTSQTLWTGGYFDGTEMDRRNSDFRLYKSTLSQMKGSLQLIYNHTNL